VGKIINPATGKPFAEARPSAEVVKLRETIRRVLNKYDAAQTTSQNELHWINADELSPHSTNTLAVRKKLRARSRYEVANNGYLKGILLTLATDFVGSGPTLQVVDRRFTPEQKQLIEDHWDVRAKKIKLRRKLWQMRYAKIMDGETFAFSYRDAAGFASPLVNQRVFECDQVSHDAPAFSRERPDLEIDGVRFSRVSGEPSHYHLLYDHPGESQFHTYKPYGQGEWVSEKFVIHWFRRDRQYLRGIPETVPTLPLWALLRRYTLAVVQNAEIAADFTVLLKSIQSPNTQPFPLSGTPAEPTQSDPNDWFSSFPVDRGLMTVLPSMYDMQQLDPKQPVTMYDHFVNALVQEASRPLLVPRNVALGNSGGYNMASGTLDRQMYRGSINEERLDSESEVLDRDLSQWWFEAARVRNYFADEIGGNGIADVISKFADLRYEPPDHIYRWDEVPEHTDPVRVAAAIDMLHRGGHISDIDVQEGRFNRRIEDHYRNLERQQAERARLGLLTTGQPGEEDYIEDDIEE
jgi:hypothetical protein